MKVTVDYDICASTGSCMQVCPEVFEVRSDGYLYVLQEEPGEELRAEGHRGRRPLPDRRHHRRGLTPSGAPRHGTTSVGARWASTIASPRPGRRRARCCASGLDPDPAAFPDVLDGGPDAIERFCRAIVDATADLVCAFKPQFAHFASQRAEPALEAVCRYVRETYPDVVLVLDAKRGDVGSTAEHYAKEAFGRYAADAVTVNPYLGTDAAAPFLAAGGVLALCHTSNAGSAELQDLDVGGAPLFERVATMVADALVRARRGRAGGRGDVPGAARRGPGDRRRPARARAGRRDPGRRPRRVGPGRLDGSRHGPAAERLASVLYASRGEDFADAARAAAIATRDAINAAG